MAHRRFSAAWLRSFLAALTVFLACVSGGAALAQHSSSECPAQSASVTSGGSVTINVTDCAYNIGFAGSGIVDGGSFGPADFPDHGSGNLRIDNGQWLLDYSHNGSTGIGGTDVFEFADASYNGDGDVLVTITINASTSPITVLPNTLPTLTAGTPFTQSLSSSGGSGSYTYALQSGALPAGVSLTSGGLLTGTPTARGNYSFSVRSTDSNSVTADKGYTGIVQNPSLSLASTSATVARNTSFSRQLTVNGGVGPYAFLLEPVPGNNLPAGLTLSSTGLISGITNDPGTTFPLNIRITDSSTGPGQYFELETFTLTLTNNLAPSANAGPDQTVASGAAVTLTGAASSDPESQPLTYVWTQTSGPAVTLSSTTAASPTFTAPTVPFNSPAVALTFSLTVSDGVLTSTADGVTITVNPTPNVAPTANAGPDQTVASGAAVSLNGAASSDPEGQPLVYVWTRTSGPTVTLTGSTTAAPTFTAPTVPFGSPPVVFIFSLTVNDGVQSSAADTVRITVNPAPNQSPVANAGPDQSVASGANVTLTGAASSDPDGQPLSYLWTQTAGPPVLSGATTVSPSFTAPTVPFNAAPVVLTFSLAVSDGVATVSDSVTITVNPAPNQIPTANAGPDQTVASGAGVTLNGTASSDPEAQSLSYAWSQVGGPAVTITNASGAQPTFTAPTVPFNAAPQLLTFSLTVYDGVQFSPADTVNITVSPAPNLAPTANAGPDQTVATAASVMLSGSASSDPEGQPLSYSWFQTGGVAVTLSGATTVNPTFTAPSVPFNAAPLTLTFGLIVNDGAQNSVVDSVTIIVSPAPNLPPTANAGVDQLFSSGSSVTLSGAGSSDPEAQPLSYGWSQIAGPAVTLANATSVNPSFTAPTVPFNASPVALTFSLTVNDGVQNSSADTVTITINPAPNLAPTANAGANQTVGSAASVTLDGFASSDPENQPLSFTWSQSGGPSVTLSGASTASPSFTAPTVPFDSVAVLLTFDLVVNDGVQNSMIDSVIVTVNPAPNLAPTANAGPDQTVLSGAAVTLDGTASTDPEMQSLTYTWAQTGGPAVTLSGANVAQPTFSAPTLAFNVPDAVLTFSLIVNDGAQDSVADTVTVTVTAPVDVTNPTVTLSGMPASVLPGDVVQITVTFSEPVTGLAAGDFVVANGTVTGLSGSGSSYVLSVTASGGGTLSVSLPADQAFDVADNGNEASNVVESGAGAVAETQEAIATYLQTRANALVGAQPGLIKLLTPTGQPQIAVSSKGFTFSLSGDHPVWASVTGSWGDSGEADTRYVLGAVGAHTWLNDRTILGLMLELDQMTLDEADRTIEGTGWLVGPYIAGQVQDQPLFYEGRLLWGETRNEISQFGLPSDRFDSERLLAQIKLQGEYLIGTTRLQPFIDGSYVSDRQKAYVDGLGNPIGAQRVDQTQVALGLDTTWRIEQGGGVLEPLAGFSAIYSDSSGSGVATAVDPAFDGWRGKIKGGIRYSSGETVVDVMTFYDGIGVEDYRDYGLNLMFSTRF